MKEKKVEKGREKGRNTEVEPGTLQGRENK